MFTNTLASVLKLRRINGSHFLQTELDLVEFYTMFGFLNISSTLLYQRPSSEIMTQFH